MSNGKWGIGRILFEEVFEPKISQTSNGNRHKIEVSPDFFVEFEHDPDDGLASCLRAAADAVEGMQKAFEEFQLNSGEGSRDDG